MIGCAQGSKLDRAIVDVHSARRRPGQHHRVEAVFHRENTLLYGVGIVGVKDGDGTLGDDGSGVHARVDQVHGRARYTNAGIKRLLLGVHARKSGQQGRVNIEHPRRELGQESGR